VSEEVDGSRELTKRRYADYVFPAVRTYYEEPVVVERGSGTKLYDVDGSEYLDFFGGILTVQIGHAQPKMVSRLASQLERFSHSSTLYQIPPMAELAARLAAITPGRLQKSFFTNSGTEANETAVTAARQPPATRSLLLSATAITGGPSLLEL